jgi:hypothetical protein
VGAALTLAAAAGIGNSYMILIASRLAQMNGWTEEQVTALTTGTSTNAARDLTQKRLSTTALSRLSAMLSRD